MKGQNKSYNSVSHQIPFYRKVWFYVLMLIIIAAAVFSIWFFIIQPRNSNSNSNNNNSQSALDQSNASSGSVPSQTAVKGTSQSSDSSKETEPNPQTPAQYEGEDPNTANDLTGFISYSAVNGDRLSLRLTLNQYLSSGTCTLTMSSNGKTFTDTATIFADASTSTCQGFDIPLSQLGSGTWSINIDLSSEGKTGTISGEYSL